MFSHAGSVHRGFGVFPSRIAIFFGLDVALLNGCVACRAGLAGGVHIQLPRRLRGRMMNGCGERRRRNEGGQSHGRKKLLHVTSPLMIIAPNSEAKRTAFLAVPPLLRCARQPRSTMNWMTNSLFTRSEQSTLSNFHF